MARSSSLSRLCDKRRAIFIMSEITCLPCGPVPCTALVCMNTRAPRWSNRMGTGVMEERPWVSPSWISAIDRRVGLVQDQLKFSYAIFRKDGARIVTRSPDVFRLVSELRLLKGDVRAWLCNETGRAEVGRLDRDKAESNASLDEWHRGAIVHISELEKTSSGNIGRVKSTTTVRMVRPV